MDNDTVAELNKQLQYPGVQKLFSAVRKEDANRGIRLALINI